MPKRFLTIFTLFFTAAAGAQDWPTMQVHLIVPFSAGSFADSSTRAISERLSARLGQFIRAGKLKALGIEPVGNTPEEYEAQVHADFALWEGVVKKAKTRIE